MPLQQLSGTRLDGPGQKGPRKSLPQAQAIGMLWITSPTVLRRTMRMRGFCIGFGWEKGNDGGIIGARLWIPQ